MKDKIKRIIEEHWPLLILFLIIFFGFGYQAIPLFSWLYCPIVLWYLRHQHYKRIVLVYATSSIAFALGFIGSFIVSDTGSRFPNAALIISVSFVLNCISHTPFLGDRYLTQHNDCVWTRVFFFPCAWTSLWFLNQRFGIIGDYFNLSTALTHWPELAQSASLGGRPLLDFLVAWFATTAIEIPDYISTWQIHPQEILTQDAVKGPSRFKHPVPLYGVLMVAIYIYGGARINIHTGSFYQVSYPHYVPKHQPVGCVVGGGSVFPDLQFNHGFWFNKSTELVEAGAKLVLWSELVAVVQNKEEEDILLQRAKDFAITHQVYLAITYGLLEPVEKNKLVFLTKGGDIAINYNKAHPVPLAETQPPGDPIIQSVYTEEFGRVGAAICFDYNFPHLLHQASELDIDVMLQSTWTWGPTGTYHAQTSHTRAVENGFTLLRCASQGLSGIFEPTMNSIFNQKVASLNAESYVFYLPIQKRIHTLYGCIGDTLSYVAMVSTLAIVALTIQKKYLENELSI